MVTVSIVQPYLPSYRVALFSAVYELLKKDSIALRVITGTPTRKQAGRQDAVLGQAWQIETTSRHLMIGKRWLRTHHAWWHWQRSSAVIVELAAGLVDTYVALTNPGMRAVGVWGHVGRSQPGPEQRLIEWQCRHADHVFAYTDAGARRLNNMGVDAARVSTVQNAIDTTALIRLMRSDVWDPATFAYIGALDETKRLDLLIRLLRRWVRDDISARLLVGGEGPGRAEFERDIYRNHVCLLGRVNEQQKAEMLSAAAAILCPGRVGLIAVDSLAAGVPVITMASHLHAPELEYLIPGQTCVVSPADDDAYVDSVMSLVGHRERLSRLRLACQAAPVPTVERAAHRMTMGIYTLLDSVR